MVYEQYTWKPEYEGLPGTYGGFAIIQGVVEGRPAVCIKQRNGNGGSPYLFDLPGGGMRTEPNADAIDTDLRAACTRETLEEVRVRCNIVATIGQPLYLPTKKDDVLIKVDCAQAFLVCPAHAREKPMPMPSEEALVVAFVHQQSFAGFNVVSRKADPQSPVFGRTPIMIFDGLSVIQEPFWQGMLTERLRPYIGDTSSSDFQLVDDGAYFGRCGWTRTGTYLKLYHRLNPDQPNGYFQGSLDGLAV